MQDERNNLYSINTISLNSTCLTILSYYSYFLVENSEFVCFLRDIGVKSVYDSNNFFKEMATTTNTPLSNLPKTVLKMELFINNFEKFTYRNHKVLYLHSSNAVAMRNLTLQMYLQ